MASTVPQPEHTFEVSVDMLETTMGGWFGGQADWGRRFTPGLKRCYIDGVEVDHETFEAAVAESRGGTFTYRQG